MSRVLFSSIFELNITVFKTSLKSYVFCEIEIVTPPEGGGGLSQCHQMTHGGGGSKLGQTSVTCYLNGPLNTFSDI
jgi:hypothetical protein